MFHIFDKKNIFIIAFFILIYCVIFFIYIDEIGITWDEFDYIQSSQNHFKLIKSLFTDNKNFTKNFTELNGLSHQHPALSRWIQGFFYKFVNLYQVKYLNFRLGNLIFIFIFIASSALFILNCWNYKILALYLLFNLINPSFVFYMFTGTMDFPLISTAVLLSAFYFLDFEKKKFRNFLLLCLAAGFGFAVKLNFVIFLLICFITAALFSRKKIFFLSAAVIFMFITLFAFYPFLWKDPVLNFQNYFRFHRNHFQNYEYFFHKIYGGEKSEFVTGFYAILYFIINYAEISVICGIAGTIYLMSRKKISEKHFYLICAAWLQTAFFIFKPDTPLYNKTRLFISSLPFLNLIACIFIVETIESFANIKKKIVSAVFIILFTISIISFFRTSPELGSHFNFFMYGGGIEKAEKTGLQIDTWGESLTLKKIEFINRVFKKNAKIYIAGHHPETAKYLQRINVFRKDFIFNSEVFEENPDSFDYIVLLNNKSLWNDKIREMIKRNDGRILYF